MRSLVLALALAALSACAVPASAELTQRGDLFVRFDGGISPQTLPRAGRAPIGVRIEGRVRTLGGERPPALRRLRIALNRGGRLHTRGLPLCGKRQIANVGVAGALRACGPSLVGTGGTVAKTTFEDQRNATVRGTLLFFATKVRGRDAILGYVFQGAPAPATDVMVFRIRRTKRGPFGTVIGARVPDSLAKNAYLTQIFMNLKRSYAFHGKRRSYLSAACAAPQGFPVARFHFAKATATFDDGRVLSSTMVRSCRVRGAGRARSSAEPDDRPDQAGGPLGSGVPANGEIERRGDADHYFFYVTSRDRSAVELALDNRGGGPGAATLNAVLTDSSGDQLGALQYVGKGQRQATMLTLAPQKYFVEVTATEAFDDEGSGDAYALSATGALGPYERIAGRCAAAGRRVAKARRAGQRLQFRRQRAVARLRLARLSSPRARRHARASYRRLRARIARRHKALRAAARSRQPWCSIPQ